MRSVEDIKADIKSNEDLIASHSRHVRKLRQELADVTCPYKPGDRIKVRHYARPDCEVMEVRPPRWGWHSWSVLAWSIKKDGKRGNRTSSFHPTDIVDVLPDKAAD